MEGGGTNGGEGLSLQRRHERDFQPSGMSKSAPKQEVTEMVADRTGRSRIGNVQECEHARTHHTDCGHERRLLPPGMSKRERAQEVTTMISCRIGPHIRRQQPGETTRSEEHTSELQSH